jgi:hypothetical protein
MNMEDFNETIEETSGFLDKLSERYFKNTTIAVVGLCIVSALATGQVSGKDFGEFARHKSHKAEVLRHKLNKSLDDNRKSKGNITFNPKETKKSLQEKLERFKSTRNAATSNSNNDHEMVDYMSDEEICNIFKELDPLKAKAILTLGLDIAIINSIQVNSPLDIIKVANNEIKENNPKYMDSIIKPTLSQIGEELIKNELIKMKSESEGLTEESSIEILSFEMNKKYNNMSNSIKIIPNQDKLMLKNT